MYAKITGSSSTHGSIGSPLVAPPLVTSPVLSPVADPLVASLAPPIVISLVAPDDARVSAPAVVLSHESDVLTSDELALALSASLDPGATAELTPSPSVPAPVVLSPDDGQAHVSAARTSVYATRRRDGMTPTTPIFGAKCKRGEYAPRPRSTQ
jgi:hypothetical protein